MSRYWLKIPAKVREQVTRAGRLFALTFAAQFLAAGEPVSWKAVCALIVAAGEVVVRQLVPVTPVKQAVSVPAVPEDKQAGYGSNELLIGLACIVVIVGGLIWILHAVGH